MRYTLILCFLLTNSLSAASNEELEAQIKQMDARIKLLEAKVTALQGKLVGKQSHKTPLDDIKLPANPTIDQVNVYLDEIMATCVGKNSFSSNDKEIDMIKKIGSKHVPLLIDRLNQRRHSGSFYIKYALESMVDNSHKELIISKLEDVQSLADVVYNRGWQEDAREILLRVLKQRKRNLDSDWIQCVAALADESTIPDLKWHFLHSSNSAWIYQHINAVPNIDLTDEVKKVWQRSKFAHDYERLSMAKIAIAYGHKDALEALIDGLKTSESEWQRREIRQTLNRHLSKKGSNEELLKWFKWHKDEVTFNKEKKMFEWQE